MRTERFFFAHQVIHSVKLLSQNADPGTVFDTPSDNLNFLSPSIL